MFVLNLSVIAYILFCYFQDFECAKYFVYIQDMRELQDQRDLLEFELEEMSQLSVRF